MAAVKEPTAVQDAAAVAAENPFGEGGVQVMLTAPYDAHGLAMELSAAMPGVASALRAPAKPDEPVSADNPAWLSLGGEGVSVATVRKVVAAHVPTLSGDVTRNIRGSDVAQGIQDLRERLSAGEVLDAIGCSKAIALLLGVYPPESPTTAE